MKININIVAVALFLFLISMMRFVWVSTDLLEENFSQSTEMSDGEA